MLYYEEEIKGEAYFAGLADKLSNPAQRDKMNLMAQLETYTAMAMYPLLQKYGLNPRSVVELHANGSAHAADAPQDWTVLMAEMAQTFPQYIDAFKALESRPRTKTCLHCVWQPPMRLQRLILPSVDWKQTPTAQNRYTGS